LTSQQLCEETGKLLVVIHDQDAHEHESITMLPQYAVNLCKWVSAHWYSTRTRSGGGFPWLTKTPKRALIHPVIAWPRRTVNIAARCARGTQGDPILFAIAVMHRARARPPRSPRSA